MQGLEMPGAGETPALGGYLSPPSLHLSNAPGSEQCLGTSPGAPRGGRATETPQNPAVVSAWDGNREAARGPCTGQREESFLRIAGQRWFIHRQR